MLGSLGTGQTARPDGDTFNRPQTRGKSNQLMASIGCIVGVVNPKDSLSTCWRVPTKTKKSLSRPDVVREWALSTTPKKILGYLRYSQPF